MHVQRETQISIFLENRVGALAEICKLIADKSINLYAICAIDTIEEAVLRIVAHDATEVKSALESADFRFLETEILLVELENVPGATGLVASGTPAMMSWGAGLFLVSMLFDRADGILARLSGKTSEFGHRFDLFTDALCNAIIFVGLGVGNMGSHFGAWAVVLGLLAGGAVATQTGFLWYQPFYLLFQL